MRHGPSKQIAYHPLAFANALKHTPFHLRHLGQATREERATGPPGWMKQIEGVQGEAFEADEEIGDEAYLMDARYEEDTWAGR